MTHRVTFCDIENEHDLIEWSVENCRSFAGVTTTDISDVSLQHDTLHDFFFETESDAIWFKLRWS